MSALAGQDPNLDWHSGQEQGLVLGQQQAARLLTLPEKCLKELNSPSLQGRPAWLLVVVIL